MTIPSYRLQQRSRQGLSRNRSGLGLSLLLALCMLCPPDILADEDDWLWLHQEVEAGRILPLSEILDQLSREWIGEVIEVEIEEDDGVTLYEIELLGPDGQVVEFEIDARTGEIVEMEGSNIQSMKRP